MSSGGRRLTRRPLEQPTRRERKKHRTAADRHALVEASCSAVRAPGPIHAFCQRISARRGHQAAIVAAPRKLACLFWCLLTRSEDYAYAQPSLTRKKLRRLELRAGAERGKAKPGTWAANKAIREAERELARQAEVADWQRAQAKKGAGVTTGRASNGPSKGKAGAADHQPLKSALG